jgi:hypothetical protein
MTEVPLEEQIAMNVMDAPRTGRLIKGGQSVVVEHFSKSLLRDFLFNLSQVPLAVTLAVYSNLIKSF